MKADNADKQSHLPKVMPCPCSVAGDVIAKCAAQGFVFKPKAKARILATEAAEYQDRKYGRGNRIHNERVSGKTGKHIGWTCTVCGTRKVD